MFEPGFRPFHNAAREHVMPVLEQPVWEASPELFPFDNGCEWRKRLADDYFYDPVNGAPDVVSWLPETGTSLGTVDQIGGGVAQEVVRNARHALAYNGVDTEYVDTDGSDVSMTQEWTVFVAMCPKRFTFGSIAVDADGDGVWALTDYFFGQTLVDDGSGTKVRLYSFESAGAVSYFVDKPVHSGRWIVTTATLGRDMVLSLAVGTGTPGKVVLPSLPLVSGASFLTFGVNPAATYFGLFDIAAFAVSPSGSLPDTRVRDIQRYLNKVYGPQTPCLVLNDDGFPGLCPSAAPFGKRFVLTNGHPVQSRTAGRSLYLHPTTGEPCEIADETDAIVPPPV